MIGNIRQGISGRTTTLNENAVLFVTKGCAAEPLRRFSVLNDLMPWFAFICIILAFTLNSFVDMPAFLKCFQDLPNNPALIQGILVEKGIVLNTNPFKRVLDPLKNTLLDVLFEGFPIGINQRVTLFRSKVSGIVDQIITLIKGIVIFAWQLNGLA